MHVNNYDLTPPQELLDQCHRVLLPDSKEPLWQLKNGLERTAKVLFGQNW